MNYLQCQEEDDSRTRGCRKERVLGHSDNQPGLSVEWEHKCDCDKKHVGSKHGKNNEP